MKQVYNNNDLLMLGNPDGLRTLYDKYANRLLGYVLAIVGHRQTAEEGVVRVFTAISASKNSLNLAAYTSAWDCLTAIAQAEIQQIYNAADECKSVSDNTSYINAHKYLNKMNSVQQKVFCGVYYHRKPLIKLAEELDLTDGALRVILREAFMIIRTVKDEN